MADKKMIYDFETIFEVIMKSQTDMIELVTKWSEMLAPTARDVTFNLSGRDQPLVVPNVQKIVETINTRTLPADPSFNSVTTNAKNGQGRFTAGGVSFSGNDNEMAGGVAAGVYSAYGTCGSIWEVAGEKTLKQWPIPRYWSVAAPGQAHVHVRLDLAKIERRKPQMSEFFVVVGGPDRSLKLTLTSYTPEDYQHMTLNCPTGGQPAIWHVVVIATNQLPGIVVRGSASLLNKGA